MKTFIVYHSGNEIAMIEAPTHNSAEKRAKQLYGPSNDKINQFLRVNSWMSYTEAKRRLETAITVAYTEV